MCIAEISGMLGVFAFPALLPYFLDLWDLSNSRAGWINGIYFAGYTVAVPVLTALTDRVDARRVYLAASVLGAASNLGFALLAGGFWSAMVFRALCGLGLAGTFIPGLKALIDRLEVSAHPRAIAFYTACFGLGMSVSFYHAGKIFAGLGWQAVFAVSAAGSALALLIAGWALSPKPIHHIGGHPPIGRILDFRPVWRNRPARAYILTYACHMWEMFAARSWMVAFLTVAMASTTVIDGGMAPTTIMAVAGIGGTIASILGGELSVRLGRRRVVSAIMWTSALIALGIGFSLHLSYALAVVLCILYTLFFQGDSAAIHAGVITAAAPERRGATMALQSLAGFAAASAGSVAAGVVLDISGGGKTVLSWVFTFVSMGVVGAVGPFCLSRIRD